MLYQEFKLPKYDWVIYAFYDTTMDDVDSVMACLHRIGCNGHTAKQAYDNLTSGKLNTGLTYSNNGKTCVVLGRATDRQNFAHTYTHEITHCAIHIAQACDVDLLGEGLAYIAGDLGAMMLPFASSFLCDCCNKEVYGQGYY